MRAVSDRENIIKIRIRIRIRMVILILILIGGVNEKVEGMWCVARSDASDAALQRGLDYACAAGADCAPIMENGLCYLPNTLQAHASYAFNSFYQRSNMAPGSCDFSASATLAMTDPSYGSCVYPASPSTAGGITSTAGATPTNPKGFGGTSPVTPATTTTNPTSVYGGGGGGATGGINPSNMGPPIPTVTDSKASMQLSAANTPLLLLQMSLFLLLPLAAL